MRLAIITHAVHGEDPQGIYAYGPYVREMNLWCTYADEIEVVAPQTLTSFDPIHLHYTSNQVAVTAIPEINFQRLSTILRSIWHMPAMLWTIYQAMRRADHIHLRCPGNIGLLGCLVQMLFPSKPKTAKYAGNWDPSSSQPLSYRLQKWILNSTFLTRNMQVLVYGQWPNSSKNIRASFTATYREKEIVPLRPKSLVEPYEWLFVGSLAPGKQPLYALELFAQFAAQYPHSRLRFFGEGKQRPLLVQRIAELGLQAQVQLEGNQPKEVIEQAYRNSHFLVLVSKSEGWPKVVAEAMFWGCVPLASSVSCVPYMLDKGNRGVLLTGDLPRDGQTLQAVMEQPQRYVQLRTSGIEWSQTYTLDRFETEIKNLLACESYN